MQNWAPSNTKASYAEVRSFRLQGGWNWKDVPSQLILFVLALALISLPAWMLSSALEFTGGDVFLRRHPLWIKAFGIGCAVVSFAGSIRSWRRERAVAHRATLSDVPKTLSERVMTAAREPGGKIAAIKIYREETGASLRQAKDVVESWIEASKTR
jgi:hypothetical protein